MFTRNPNNVSRSPYATHQTHQYHKDEHDFDLDDLDKNDDVAMMTDEVGPAGDQSDVAVRLRSLVGHQGWPSKPHEQGFQTMSSSSETSSCHHNDDQNLLLFARSHQAALPFTCLLIERQI